MADKKISALTAATTPLAGTEVLPIVQSSTTVKVAVSDLTAGRSVSASSLALTGSPLPVTSGGTGTATQFTLGSVVFAGTSGTYSQDNANFLWDFSNKRLGLGTATPAYTLDVSGNARVTGIVGVGVTPVAGIQVYARAGTTGTGFYADNGSNSGFTVKFASGTTSIGNDFNAPLELLTNNTAKVRISTDGNLAITTAGKGIDFSANSHAAGMTSELLTWYEEGTWTPTVTSGTGTITSYTSSGKYTRIGRQVTINVQISITNNGTGASDIRVGGLPFTAESTNYAGSGFNSSTGYTQTVAMASTTTLITYKYDATYPVATGQGMILTITYFV
jgi:hypothetical protein